MNVQQFYDMIADEAAKGRALDRAIPNCFRRAVQFIEQNYDITYMRSRERKSLTTREFDFPTARYKKLLHVRLVNAGSDGLERYRGIPRVTPERMISQSSCEPAGYVQWADKVEFDAVQTSPVQIADFYTVRFTDFNCLKPTDSHPLIDQFEGALVSSVMLNLMPYAREPDWAQTYGSVWEVHQKVLTIAQDEFDYSGDPSQWVMGDGA